MKVGHRAISLLAIATWSGWAGSAYADVCLEDAVGHPVNCTANVFAGSFLDVIEVKKYCESEFDTFVVDATVSLVTPIGADADLYDVGLFISSGDQALTGECVFLTIPVDSGDLDGDFCGDYLAGTTLSVTVLNLTGLCTRAPEYISICATFTDDDSSTCTSNADVLPANGSDCDCDIPPTEAEPRYCETDDDCPPCSPKSIFCNYNNRTCKDPVCVKEPGEDFGECGLADNSAPCDDGFYCNGEDTCSGGTCSLHAGDPCPGEDVDADCTESCDETAENCTAADANDSPCDDGDACSFSDVCAAGSCTGQPNPDCSTTTTVTTTSTSTTLAPALCGDATDDGDITSADAQVALNAAVGLTSCSLQVCDYSGDGKVTTNDALLILRAAVGLPVQPHCPVAA